ncbi:hypothetical protein ACLOJK_024632 [Asimina triloba]
MPERFEGGCLSPNTGLENPMLVMSSFRAETHVAQQSRRDKLRVQHSTSTSNHSIQDFQASMLNSVADPDHHPRSLRNYDIVYDPSTAIFSSEMLNFTSSAAAAAATEPSGGGGPSSIENNHHLASHSSSVPASCSYWNKGPSPSQTPGGDWNLVSYASGNQGSQLFVGGVKEGNNISSSSPSYIKPPPYSHLHDLSTQEGNPQKQHYGELHYNPTVFYQNAIPDVVPSSSSSSGFEMAGQGSWVDAGNELLLLPSFGNVGQTAWMNRPTAGSGGGAAEGSQQWVGDHDFVAEKREGGGGGGLSLSLSSHSPSDLRVVAQLEQSPQDSKTGCLGGYYCSYAKSPVGSMSRSLGNSLQSIIVGSSSSDHIRRGGTAGPLGPFTGYATILKNSKFLKPAQQLLDELCSVMGPKRTSEAAGSDRDKGSNASMSCDTATNGETEAGGRGGNSGVSTCSFYSSTEGGSGSGSGSGGSGGGDGGNGGSGGGCQHFRPEFHKKKAKLLYMQEEVSFLASSLIPFCMGVVLGSASRSDFSLLLNFLSLVFLALVFLLGIAMDAYHHPASAKSINKLPPHGRNVDIDNPSSDPSC